ncbi:MAG: response regulator [Chitinophagaceae bacterium]|nr:response regulator [Chitinophagaceae bacterium]
MNPKLNCVLVIDDDEPTNFFTQMILEESGCTENIRVLQSGQEALDYLPKSESEKGNTDYPCPDLIFLDINMPAMDGWEFLEEYRKLNVSRKIIVVMLTTSLFPEDKLRATAIPEISGFENKPLTPEKITAVMEKYFTNVPLK